MKYLGETQTGIFVIRVDTDEEMNRLYDWAAIENGVYIEEFGSVLSPWHYPFRDHLVKYIREEFAVWLNSNARNAEGMPLYSLEWKDGYYESRQYYTWKLHINFYRERAAALFRLTFG